MEALGPGTPRHRYNNSVGGHTASQLEETDLSCYRLTRRRRLCGRKRRARKQTLAGSRQFGVEIAFVNNMPDSAFDETERQFLGLLEGATREIGDITVRFSRYSLPVSSEVRRRAAGRSDYWPIDHICVGQPDGLIVTGTEPLTDDLRTESYWDALAELIGWAEGSTASTLLSCLAAHAAALLSTGSSGTHSPSSARACSSSDQN